MPSNNFHIYYTLSFWNHRSVLSVLCFPFRRHTTSIFFVYKISFVKGIFFWCSFSRHHRYIDHGSLSAASSIDYYQSSLTYLSFNITNNDCTVKKKMLVFATSYKPFWTVYYTIINHSINPPNRSQISIFQGFIRRLSNSFIVCFIFRTVMVSLSLFYPHEWVFGRNHCTYLFQSLPLDIVNCEYLNFDVKLNQ